MDLIHEYDLRAVLVTKEIINELGEKEIVLQGILSQNDIIRVWGTKKRIKSSL